MADQGSEGLLSPWLRRRRFSAALPFLQGRVLDFGCGTGALAGHIPADRYWGVDRDATALDVARSCYPMHQFTDQLPDIDERFDTVVSLAVIEHVSNPGEFLKLLRARLRDSSRAHLVITTPHPSVDWVHDAGATIGLFSKHANEEHEALLDSQSLRQAGADAGLNMVSYQRFLFFANQIAIYAAQS